MTLRLIAAQILNIHDMNRRSAEAGCAFMDRIARQGLTPTDLLESQDAIRRDLLGVESHLRALRSRAKERGRRLAPLQKNPASREAVERHVETMMALERALQLRRLCLRQIADALAWWVLGQDPRMIFPLYLDHQHHLPLDEGIGGPAEIARKAMTSGKFHVVENDLTRCLGVGDLTVVYADRPWRHPLSVELKSSAKTGWREGGQLEIQAIIVHADDPLDEALYDDFTKTVGLGPVPAGVKSKEKPDQTAAMLSRAELLIAAFDGSGPREPAANRHTWEVLGNVLNRALAEGECFDISERGVLFFAIRATDDRAPDNAIKNLMERLDDAGYGKGCKIATSVDLRNEDAWSALVLPVPLWPVSRDARAASLSGGLFLGCIIHPDVWADAMRDERLEIIDDDDGWTIEGPNGKCHLDVIEVHKLTLGVAFGGVSPAEIAERIATIIDQTRNS